MTRTVLSRGSEPTRFHAPPSELTYGEAGEIFERVRVPLMRPAGWDLPIVLVTVHDGHRVPACAQAFARDLDARVLEHHFVRERDWGADAMAFQLARHLGLPAFHRVTAARAFLDCGRPHGISGPEDRGLETKAVPHRVAGIETPEEVRQGLLGERLRFGDAFGRLLERTLEQTNRRVLDSGALFLAIHTYDRFGERLQDSYHDRFGERAPISLVYRPRVDEEARAKFPEAALRDTSDPGLIRKLDASFHSASIQAVHNDPYVLPMGGLEIPALNWMFERAHRQDPDFEPLHPSRRPSALVIEFRKDLLLEGSHTPEGWFRPEGGWRHRAIGEIAHATAAPILEHFHEIDPERYARAG